MLPVWLQLILVLAVLAIMPRSGPATYKVSKPKDSGEELPTILKAQDGLQAVRPSSLNLVMWQVLDRALLCLCSSSDGLKPLVTGSGSDCWLADRINQLIEFDRRKRHALAMHADILPGRTPEPSRVPQKKPLAIRAFSRAHSQPLNL